MARARGRTGEGFELHRLRAPRGVQGPDADGEREVRGADIDDVRGRAQLETAAEAAVAYAKVVAAEEAAEEVSRATPRSAAREAVVEGGTRGGGRVAAAATW